jgi:hypothetical protein
MNKSEAELSLSLATNDYKRPFMVLVLIIIIKMNNSIFFNEDGTIFFIKLLPHHIDYLFRKYHLFKELREDFVSKNDPAHFNQGIPIGTSREQLIKDDLREKETIGYSAEQAEKIIDAIDSTTPDTLIEVIKYRSEDFFCSGCPHEEKCNDGIVPILYYYPGAKERTASEGERTLFEKNFIKKYNLHHKQFIHFGDLSAPEGNRTPTISLEG